MPIEGINENFETKMEIGFMGIIEREISFINDSKNELIDTVISFSNELQISLLSAEYTSSKETNEKLIELQRSYRLSEGYKNY